MKRIIFNLFIIFYLYIKLKFTGKHTAGTHTGPLYCNIYVIGDYTYWGIILQYLLKFYFEVIEDYTYWSIILQYLLQFYFDRKFCFIWWYRSSICYLRCPWHTIAGNGADSGTKILWLAIELDQNQKYSPFTCIWLDFKYRPTYLNY